MSRKPRIAVDMDEVIADMQATQLAWYAANYGYSWTPDEVRGAKLRTIVKPEHAAAMEAQLHQGDIFRRHAVIPGSQEALKALSAKFDVFIATAAMEYPASCAAKYAWLREHFAFISPLNIVFCGDKSILAADVLVDDNVRHFAHLQGQGLLFSAPHNLNTDWPHRVNNWDEALAYLSDWR